MGFPTVRHENLTVIYLSGIVRSGQCDELRAAVERELDAGIRRFVFNMRDVVHLDSTAVGAVIGLQHRVVSLGGSLVFTRVPDELRGIFSISRLDNVLTIVDEASLGSGEEALPRIETDSLLREVEATWERLRQPGEGAKGLPVSFTAFLADIESRCRRLLEANRVLRDLVAQGDVEVRDSEARYRALFDAAGDAVLVVESGEGTVIEANGAAANLTAFEKRQLVGVKLTELLPDLAGLGIRELIEALRAQASLPAEASLSLLRADGSHLPVHVATGVAEALGQEVILIHLRDVSVFRQVEENLREQVFQLSSLNALERRLASCLERRRLLRELVVQTSALLRAEAGAALGLDPSGERIEGVDLCESEEDSRELRHSARDVSVAVPAVRALLRRAIVSPADTEAMRSLVGKEILPRSWLSRGWRWVSVELSQGERAGAALLLARREDQPWDERDFTILHNLRTMASLSLANASHVQEIRRAHSEYRRLFQNSRDAIGVVDLTTGRVITANAQWAVLTNQASDAVTGSPFFNIVQERDWPQLYDEFRRLRDEGECRWECRLAQDTGDEPTWVQIRASLVQTEPTALALLILIDVTERRRRDQEIKSLSRITTSNPNIVLKVDAEGRVLYANPAVSTLLRRAGAPEESFGRLLPADITARIARMTAAPGRVETFDHTVGERVILYTLTASEEAQAGILHGVEITAQKRLEQAIAESEENYRVLVEGAREGICALRDGHFHTVNTALARILGQGANDLVGTALRDHVHASDWPQLCEQLHACAHDERGHVQAAFRVHDAEGAEHEISATFVSAHVGTTRQVLGYLTDVTAQRRLEALVQQLQRIELIGNLSSGIAHDFNDVLCGILGHVSLLVSKLEPGSEAHRQAKIIEDAAERGSALTRHLLSFARGSRVLPQVLDLNAALEECLELVRRTLGSDIIVEFVPAEEPAPAEIDRGQLRQILINLASNARDAMPRGGRLRLRVTAAVLGDPEVQRIPGAKRGAHVCIEVADSGAGIPAAIIPHIFEPFFTTKTESKRSGLGLSLVYGMISQQGGFIDVQSAVDRGTTIRLFLPRAEAMPAQPATGGEAAAGGSSTVLVIDDEELVRDLTREILADAGYQVLTAENGQMGLERFHEAQGEIAAVVLDIVMPVLNGPETFRSLRSERPDLPILLASGYASEEDTRDLLNQGHSDFLPKPFRRDALLEKLGALLTSSAA